MEPRDESDTSVEHMQALTDFTRDDGNDS